MSSVRDLEGEILRLLIRYFRNGNRLDEKIATNRITRDDNLVLAELWLNHPDVSSALASLRSSAFMIRRPLQPKKELGTVLRGTIDARETLIHQRRTKSGAYVFRQGQRNSDTDDNRVIKWFITTCYIIAKHHSAEPSTFSNIRSSWSKVALRLLAEVEMSDWSPSISLIRRMKASRNQLYAAVATAVDLYLKAMKLDSAALASLVAETVFRPCEPWQIYELYVGFKTAEALSVQLALPFTIGSLYAGSKWFAKIGNLTILWQRHHQSATPYQVDVALKAALKSYGLRASSDRPDLVIVKDDLTILSILEVKYQEVETSTGWRQPLADALEQLYRYSKRYTTVRSGHSLFHSSAVVLRFCPERYQYRPDAPQRLREADLRDNLLIGFFRTLGVQ